MRRCFLLVLVVAPIVFGATAASAFPGGPWSRPVDGPVVRGFDPPATRFGPGHLGVDFGVPPGTPVRAAGDGVVVFAGHVGTGLHVVVLHAADVRTTDSFLASIAVVTGQHVARGAVLGRTGGTGPEHAADVLHFGVRVGDDYIDPMLLFAPPDLGAVVHLAEPHGGSFGAGGRGSAEPSFASPAAATESSALASELRVDARPPLPPPPWWPSATSPAAPTRSPARLRAAPAPTSRGGGGEPVSGAVWAAGAAAPVGAFLVLRRRRPAYR